ncbi:MAG: hypothetical protein D4R97_06795 [Bacteroidetes bacterium]|nr:MAG: hypothetical protein D4R97_06795 [Bacteroidota bacterium]
MFKDWVQEKLEPSIQNNHRALVDILLNHKPGDLFAKSEIQCIGLLILHFSAIFTRKFIQICYSM